MSFVLRLILVALTLSAFCTADFVQDVTAQDIATVGSDVVGSGVSATGFVQGDLSLQIGNFNRKTIVGHWRREIQRKQQLTYPTLRFDDNTRVGDIGIGDANARFTVVQRLSKYNFLLSRLDQAANQQPGNQKQTLYEFRGYEFDKIRAGSQLSVAKLWEVTGSRRFKDKQKRIQTALIVEKRLRNEIPLPAGKSAEDIDAPAEPNSSVQKVASQKTASAKPATNISAADISAADISAIEQEPSSQADERPRFQRRKWKTLTGDRSVDGILVGVASEAVWIKIAGGKVLRIKMESLHPSDRAHAVNKKQAILDYRRTH